MSAGSAGERAALVIERGWGWIREGKVCRAEPPQRLELRLQHVCGLIEEPVSEVCGLQQTGSHQRQRWDQGRDGFRFQRNC